MISPYVATWRDGAGQVKRTAPTGTMCLAPLNPRDFAAASDDGHFEAVFRCRDCAGCRKFEDLQLRRRLSAHFGKERRRVWISEFECPSVSPYRLLGRVNRRLSQEYVEGFCRVSSTAIAKLKIGSRPSKAISLRGLTIVTTRYLVSRTASSRAWRRLTRGMLEARSLIGAWQKRFYLTGMPQLEGPAFTKQLKGGIRKRHPEALAGVRAWREGLSLYPSEMMAGREVLASLLAKPRCEGGSIHVNRPRAQRVSDVLESPLANRKKPLGRESLKAASGGSLVRGRTAERPDRFESEPLLVKGSGDAGSPSLLSGFDAIWAAVGGRKRPRAG